MDSEKKNNLGVQKDTQRKGIKMKIHAMCLVKNEADIIEECLRAAARWADHIYVYDNGSTDGTWEIVQRLSTELPQIHPWKSMEKPFSDGLRREIYENFKHLAQPGDWWCRLDADEFYVTDPRAFLVTIPQRYGVAWYASLSYYFSSVAAEEYMKHPERFGDAVPVSLRCRWYHAHWSEPRFVRHSAMLATPWPEDSRQGWPPNIESTAGSCPVRILCRHYCYRSPVQIERRIATRAAAALSGKVFNHEAIKDWAKVVDPKAVAKHKWRDIAYCTDAELLDRGWRSRVIPAESLQYDAHDGKFVYDESRILPVLPGQEMPSVKVEAIRLARRVMSAARRLIMRTA